MKTLFHGMVLASVLLLVSTSIDAQSMTGLLNGYVRSGDSPVSGATITISSASLQGTRTTVTDVNGFYRFPLLPPGEYTVRVELSGMQTVIGETPVLLSATSRFDAQLSPSPLKEAITVTGAPEPVMQTTQAATNFPSSLVNVVVGPSDMMGAAALAPGVSNPGGQPSISGGPGLANLIVVNGIPVQNTMGGAMPLFVEDAVQQTTVLTSAIPAEYGRFAGGVVSAITKSGGNEFSGSIRDSLTNASWAANRPGEDITVDKINSFYGATLGGYVLRDRLWFFGAARDQVTDKHVQTFRTNFPFTQNSSDRRYESKLTAAITPSQNLMASYFQLDKGADNQYFTGAPIYELSTIGADRKSVDRLISGNYNAVAGTRFVLEARYAANDVVIDGDGGKKTSDLAVGSWGYDLQTGAMFNAPVFCSDCGKSTQSFEAGELKGTMFFAAPRTGSHSVVAGASDYSEHMFANNYQSATDFAVLVNGVARPAGSTVPYLSPGGLVYPRLLPNRSYILWMPIAERMSRENDLNTRSAYVNDLWNFSSHFTFNVGLRYDRTHAEDANGNVTSNDGALSPRLTAVYDPLANGRHRITAAYNRYVSKIGASTGGLAMQSAGAPASIYFVYRGPTINPTGTPVDQLLDSRQAFEQAFAWLVSAAGGSTQQDFMNYLHTPRSNEGGYFPGYSTIVPDSLRATSVDEYVVGYGIQLGSGLYAKADYVDRKWHDFLGYFVLQGGPQKTDPFGMVHDLEVLRNSDMGEKTYKGLQFQLGWRPQRFNVGVTYTFASERNNPQHAEQYPELTTYPQKSPDRETSRHRGKAWVAYDLPLPSRFGALNIAALENYDSGGYYAEMGFVDPRVYAADELANYNYSYSALGQYDYFFSNPTAYRLKPVTSTDISINYSRAIARGVEGFVQAALTNAFNEQEIVSVVTSVYTNFDDPSIPAFDPRTETPVEGVNWVRDENFGKPYGPQSYQAARRYNFSFGLRF